MSVIEQKPTWERFDAMSREVHEMLIGAAQCRNHLRAIVESWEEMTPSDQLEAVEVALSRLLKAGI